MIRTNSALDRRRFSGIARIRIYFSVRRRVRRVRPGYPGVQHQNGKRPANRDCTIGTLAGDRPKFGKNRGVREIYGRGFFQELLKQAIL